MILGYGIEVPALTLPVGAEPKNVRMIPGLVPVPDNDVVVAFARRVVEEAAAHEDELPVLVEFMDEDVDMDAADVDGDPREVDHS